MLLNSVIISLNQFLPFALLCVLLLHCDISPNTTKLLSWSMAVISTSACLVFLVAADTISQWFDYRGLELGKMLMLIGIYVSVVLALSSNQGIYKQFAIVLASMLYLSHFVMFVSSYWQLDTRQGIFIGTVLGLGICLSFCTLLSFTLSWCKAQGAILVALILLSFHSASKVANAIDLAAQIDLLPSSETAFDLRFLLDEYGIIGRLLKALLGYEATPSYASLIAFLSALVLISYVIIWRLRAAEQGYAKELKRD